jgi:hypothetical protein
MLQHLNEPNAEHLRRRPLTRCQRRNRGASPQSGGAILSQVDTGEDDLKRLAQVGASDGLGELLTARHLPIGLINRNWHVATATGCHAVKQLGDPIATGARRQHQTMALAGMEPDDQADAKAKAPFCHSLVLLQR